MDGRRREGGEAQNIKQELIRQVNAQEDRIRLLTEMEKEYEGFNKAVKTVMQAAGRTRAGHPRPGGQTDDHEQTYAVALEIALGAALQNIVVERENDAKEAIGLPEAAGRRPRYLPAADGHPGRRAPGERYGRIWFCGHRQPSGAV